MALIDTIKSHLHNSSAATEATVALNEQEKASRAAMEALGASTPSVIAPSFEETVAIDANDFLAAVEGTMEARLENHYGRTMRPATIHEACYYALEETIPEGLVPPEYDPENDLSLLDESAAGVMATLQADPDQPNPEENIENSTTIGDLSNAPQDIADESFSDIKNDFKRFFAHRAQMKPSDHAERNYPKYGTLNEFCQHLGTGNGFERFKGDKSLVGVVNGLNICVHNASQEDAPLIHKAVKCVNQMMEYAVNYAIETGTWDEEEAGARHSKTELRKLFAVETLAISINWHKEDSAAKNGSHMVELYIDDGGTYGGHVIVVECIMDNNGRLNGKPEITIEG